MTGLLHLTFWGFEFNLGSDSCMGFWKITACNGKKVGQLYVIQNVTENKPIM